MVEVVKNKTAKKLILYYAKAEIIALTFTMISILLFAVFLKFLDVSNTTILTVNQIIKIISLILACIICNKSQAVNWVKGLIIGIIYALLSYIIFSLLSSNFSINVGFLYNLFFSSIIGLISGIIVKGIKQI